ncbi:MAG: flagellin lysine-N-methylase [Rhodocyclaceae bacterium]
MQKHHPTRTYDAVMPRYAAAFECTGNACEDTCCAGWNITIDALTLKACSSANPPHLTERLKRFVVPIPPPERGAGGDPARLALVPETQCCAFLEQGLCAIHRDLGEDYLSNTCSTFPRRARNLSGRVEYALDLACPEAARKALLSENALDLIEAPVTLRPATVTSLVPQDRLTPLQIDEIRGFCFQLMRVGDLLPWQRLVVIGHFCHQLEQLTTTPAPLDVMSFLDDFVRQVENGSMVARLTDAPANIAGQAQLFFKLWQGQAERKNSPTQDLVQNAVARGLGVDSPQAEPSDWAPLIRNYQAGLSRIRPALEEAPFLLHNYLMNEMFREMFPFGAATPFRHFLGLLVRFGLLRLMLGGVGNSGMETNAAQLVRITQVCSRLYPHPAFTSKAVQALAFLGFDRADRFAELLRD